MQLHFRKAATHFVGWESVVLLFAVFGPTLNSWYPDPNTPRSFSDPFIYGICAAFGIIIAFSSIATLIGRKS